MVRRLRVGTAIGAALGALLLLCVTVSVAAPQDSAPHNRSELTTARIDFHSKSDLAGPIVHARRAISIPFGISSPATILDGGRLVEVTGHGDCLGGESFEVRVVIKQFGRPTVIALGSTADSCSVGEFEWTAQAATRSTGLFGPGEAEVCATARVRNVDGRTATRHWCQTVALVTE